MAGFLQNRSWDCFDVQLQALLLFKPSNILPNDVQMPMLSGLSVPDFFFSICLLPTNMIIHLRPRSSAFEIISRIAKILTIYSVFMSAGVATFE